MKNSIGSFSRMKSTNMTLVLNKIRENGTISRVQIAKETGLTAATVTNLTAELLAQGIIVEADTGSSTGGRKPIMLKFNTSEFGICSAYISPNHVEFAVADLDANIIYYQSIPLPKENVAESCVDFIADEFRRFFARSTLTPAGIGVGLHGIVDSRSGVSVFAPNMNWNNIPIGDMLREKINIPVFADNDVRLMTMGEMWYGIAKNVSDLVFVYISSGIGGAIVINGNLYNGFKNGSGEIGHCTIDTDGQLCTCGNRGCVQTKANRTAMTEAARLNAQNLPTILGKDCDCDEIVRACTEDKDPLAMQIMENESRYLGITVNNLINMFNPKMVVVNSDIKDFDKAIMTGLLDEAGKRKMRFFENNSEIKYSKLREMAVLKGGIAMVLKNICENPSLIKKQAVPAPNPRI